MYEVVEKYLAAMQQVENDRIAAVKTATDNRDKKISHGPRYHTEAWDGYSQEARLASVAYSKGRRAAWEILSTSDDPLVRFIGEKCREYISHADQILQVLPAPLGDLWDIADREGWCTEFDSFVIDAIRAGVMPGISAQRGDLLLWLWDYDEDDGVWSAVSRGDLRDVMRMVDEVVAAHRELLQPVSA